MEHSDLGILSQSGDVLNIITVLFLFTDYPCPVSVV
jgi:hypothetical protein